MTKSGYAGVGCGVGPIRTVGDRQPRRTTGRAEHRSDVAPFPSLQATVAAVWWRPGNQLGRASRSQKAAEPSPWPVLLPPSARHTHPAPTHIYSCRCRGCPEFSAGHLTLASACALHFAVPGKWG